MSTLDKSLTRTSVDRASAEMRFSPLRDKISAKMQESANNRKKNGFVKTIVLSEHENGLTPVEIRIKHNLIKNSIYAVYYYCGITPNKKTK
jgi:hypothetical protein